MEEIAYDIGPRIGIEGEKDFKRAIREINTDMSVLNSQMKMTTETFKGQEDSMEGLTQKHEVLQKALNTQQERVKTLRAAMDNAKTTFGENDEATKRWEKALYDAQGQVAKLQREMDDTTKSMDEFGENQKEVTEGSKGFGDVLNGLAQKIGITLPEGMTKGMNSMLSFNAASLAAAAGLAAVAAAIVKVTTELVNMTIEQAAAADELLTLASTTGISTGELQEYAYAAEFVDVSLETLTGSQTKLIRNMEMARQGTKTQVEAFQSLDVQVTNLDGTLRDSEQVFWQTIDALGRMENETQRDAVAMTLMGKSAQELNPLIEAGSARMKELGAEAKKLGYVLNDDALEALGNVDDATQRLNRTMEASKKQLATQFAPTMATVLGDLNGFVEKIGKTLVDTGLVKSFGSILESVTSLLDPLAELANDIAPGLNAALEVLAYTLALIADTLKVIIGVQTFNWGMVKEGLGLGLTDGKMSSQQKIWNKNSSSVWDPDAGAYVGNSSSGGYAEFVTRYNPETGQTEQVRFDEKTGKWVTGHASGTDNFQGGWSWVGENGPELMKLPQGTQILTAQESREKAGGQTVFNITIDAKNVREFNDIIRIAQSQRAHMRMGYAGG